MDTYKRSTEIRCLSSAHIFKLAHILENSQGWKKLMRIIPKNLQTNESILYFGGKYNVEHVGLIQDHSIRQKRLSAEVLFEEWGTSGCIRPNLDHLLQLLVKADLYRAADYVALNLLNEPPPARPEKGPAAKIDITLPPEEEIQAVENLLNDMQYPNSTNINNAVKNLDFVNNNRDFYDKFDQHGSPKIQINTPQTEISDLIKFSRSNDIGMPINSDLVGNDGIILIHREISETSQSSVETVSTDIPQQSSLLRNSQSESIPGDLMQSSNSDLVLPNVSMLHVNCPIQNNNNTTEVTDRLSGEVDNNLPNISILQNNSPLPRTLDNVSPLVSQQSESPYSTTSIYSTSSSGDSVNIPNLSMLDNHLIRSDSNIPQTYSSSESSIQDSKDSILSSASDNPYIQSPFLPALSLLQQHIPDSNIEQIPNLSEFNIRNLSIPDNDIPNLSALNLGLRNESSQLQRFEYNELKVVTDNFNTLPYDKNTKLGRKLGSGGFGSVYLALNITSNIRHAAVKRLKPEQYKVNEKFQLEIDVLSNHSHENLVKLLGYSNDGPELCLIYEYIKDGTLEGRMANCRAGLETFPWMKRIQVAVGCANGIDYLHSKVNIIHRDIKSANVLLHDNIPKLCDFGLIKSLNSSTTTSVIGTHAYMAPEAFRGDNSDKVDVFALGVILLELLTGMSILDNYREGIDLVTHIQHSLSENKNITDLIDSSAGAWNMAGVQLFEIAMKCLEEKWKRPDINVVFQHLHNIFTQFC